MKTNYTEEQKYYRAKKKVEDLKGFYANVIAYCVVNPFLIFINLKFSPHHHWFWYPMIGWGIGIIFHAIGVFNKDYILGSDWEERKIREYMENDDKQYWE